MKITKDLGQDSP